MMICENVLEFYLEQLPKPAIRLSLYMQICDSSDNFGLLAWRRSKSFKRERVLSGHPTMAGLPQRICMFQKL